MTTSKDLFVPFYWLLALVGLAGIIVYIESRMVVPPIGLLLDSGNLTDAQSTAIRYIPELGKLMINWCVAILGAIAVSVRSIMGWTGINKWVFGGTLSISFIACILSIWLGMMVIDLLIFLLSIEQDPLQNTTLLLSRRWQYIFFVISLVFFAFSWLSVSTFNVHREREVNRDGTKEKDNAAI